MGVLNNQAQ